MKNYLENKIILITGSARPNGIGAATARLAKGYGAQVIIHGRTDSDSLKSISRQLGCDYVVADATIKEEVSKAVQKVLKKCGKIDALINCIRAVEAKPLLENTDDDWIERYKANVLSVVHFCQAVVPAMKKARYGRIVNIGSIRGHKEPATIRNTPYGVAKSGVINLTAALAKELAPDINVNSVSPGMVETDMAKTWNEKVWEQAKGDLVGRVGQPKEIGEVLCFLASEKASFITGQDILVDGGYTLFGK